KMALLAWRVLVTASNRGIGLEPVRQLAASPWPPHHILAACHHPNGPRGKVSQRLCDPLELSSTLFFAPADMVNVPSIQGAMQAVGSHLKDEGLNPLINNADVSCHATLHSLDSQEMLSTFATNVVGPLQVIKEFLLLLEKAVKCAGKEGLSCSRATVINVSTKLGSITLCLRVPQAPMYSYRASKDAQNMVKKSLAAELQEKGILCTAIHPGWVKTDMGTEEALGCVGKGQQ
ncbi:H17B6 dehydrogenase, partial [Rostratula benghalensis]|nr:H17B6 dehydrogenase [Rostratula benghalensis]